MFGLKNNKINYRKNLTLCFTGHRPNKLPWGYNENKDSCVRFKHCLLDVLENAIKNGYSHFISGMALGVDIICAETVLKLKQKYKKIFLECAIPCRNQTLKWTSNEKKRYNKILKKADCIFFVSDEYSVDCMNKRNEYMIDKSDAVLGVWNKSPSGTAKTINMAINKNKKIKIIDLNEF